MIPGTSYSPGEAFISFVREFFEALAREDVQGALGKLDASHKRWTKNSLLLAINEVTNSVGICSTVRFSDSASPELEETTDGYVLRHRLPVQQRWSSAIAVFEFTRKPRSEYFRVGLRGFEL